jgi:hypothetical protein
MIGLLRRLMSGKSEDASEYDGFLSAPDERHALANGFFRGLYDGRRSLNPVPSKCSKYPSPEDDAAGDELHYWRGGFILGTVVQYAAIGVGATQI